MGVRIKLFHIYLIKDIQVKTQKTCPKFRNNERTPPSAKII